MLTEQQRKWIDHLRNDDKIVIKPYDETAPQKFEAVKAKIQNYLSENVDVRHCGATSLGISGQDEIDVYIPVSPDKFNSLIPSLTNLFGEPRSNYPLERVRFVTIERDKHVDVFLINEESDGWLNSVRFETYLKTHPNALDAYRKLKEEGKGLSTREYYRRKIEFINGILELAPKNE